MATGRFIDTGAYNNWLAAQNAAQQSTAQTIPQALPATSSKKFGLGQLLAGIGEAAGDAGRSLVDLFGAGVASIGDLTEKITTGKLGTRADDFSNWVYGTDNAKDAAYKRLGGTLNAVSTVADFIPGVAIVTNTPLGNAVQGAISGFSDELKQGAEGFSIEDAGKRALAGAGAGLVAGGLSKGISSNIAKQAAGESANKALANKITKSAIGRGAVTGAVGGGIGGGIATALEGGDIGEVLGNTLSTAGAGALTGGIASGAINAGVKLPGRINNLASRVTKSGANAADSTAGVKNSRTQPLDYQGEIVNIEQPNIIQKAGRQLTKAGNDIKNSDVTNTLHSRLAKRVIANDSINKLAKLGYSPTEYGEAAKVSTVVNRYIDDALDRSGAQIVDNDLATRISARPKGVVIESPSYERALNKELSELQSRIQDGDIPNQFSVSALNKESRRFGELADIHYRKSTDVAGNITNTNERALADVYSNVMKELRSLADKGVEGLSDAYTRGNLKETLVNAGANKKTIEYIMGNKNLQEYIRATSLFEDARRMADDMATTPIKRGANSGASNPITVALQSSGIPQATGVALRPVGRATGGALEAAGNLLQKVNTPNVASPRQPAGIATLSPTTQNAIYETIGRGEGITQGAQIQDHYNAEQQQAQPTSLEQALSVQSAGGATYDPYGNMSLGAGAGTNSSISGSSTTPYPSSNSLVGQLSTIENAMRLALEAGDITAYSQLSSLYASLYDIVGAQQQAATTQAESTLSSTQQNKLIGIQNAIDSINLLEQMFSAAGGGQGIVGGNLADFGAAIGLNDNAAIYNSEAKALINTIKDAIGKTDAANYQFELDSLMNMIPKLTDTQGVAAGKLQRLRQSVQAIYENTLQGYGQ
jgi:hypothetical protein